MSKQDLQRLRVLMNEKRLIEKEYEPSMYRRYPIDDISLVVADDFKNPIPEVTVRDYDTILKAIVAILRSI